MAHSLQPHGLWNFLGQNTGVGSLSLVQGIFPTQGLNPDLPHCRWIFYQLSYKGSPRILEWVAYPFSRESSQPRNQTGVSFIAGGFFTIVPREKPSSKATWSIHAHDLGPWLVFSEHTDPLKLCREIHQHCPHSGFGLTFHFELLTWLTRATTSFHGTKAGDSLVENCHESCSYWIAEYLSGPLLCLWAI